MFEPRVDTFDGRGTDDKQKDWMHPPVRKGYDAHRDKGGPDLLFFRSTVLQEPGHAVFTTGLFNHIRSIRFNICSSFMHKALALERARSAKTPPYDTFNIPSMLWMPESHVANIVVEIEMYTERTRHKSSRCFRTSSGTEQVLNLTRCRPAEGSQT